MTSRTLNRSLIIHNDLALGYGTTLQTRGTSPETAEQKIEIDFIFRSNNEIRYLDTNKYTRASIHTNGPLIHYVFDPNSAGVDNDNTILAPIPIIAVGRWIRVTSSSSSYSYATVAELIADIVVVETIAPGTQVAVSGYHEAGDFGGGAFYWDELSTETHDGGMVLTPTGRTDPGRWIRIISTLLSVHHFGAVGDNIVNDRTAVEAALTASATYKISVAFRDLSYNVAGFDLTITSSIRIIGTGWPLLYGGTQLTFACNSVSIINLGIVNWTEGINLEPQSGTGTGVATYNFEQFNAVGCAYGMQCTDAAAVVETLRIRGGYFQGALLRHAYYFVGKVEVADIENIKIESIGNVSDNNITVGIGLGVTTQDCDTIIIRNCEMKGFIANTNIRCNAIQIAGDRVIIANNIISDVEGAGTGKTAIDIFGNCVITNNTINCPAAVAGIYISELTDSNIADNQITALNNAIQSAAPLITYAIQHTIFSNNFLKADKGITFTEARQVRIDNNIFVCAVPIDGNYKHDWWFRDGVMTTTSAKFLAQGDIVNLMTYKQLGLMVWDETLGQPLYVGGVGIGGIWVDATGATVHTPV